jgi:putative addiction module component (TIGR02574 family)
MDEQTRSLFEAALTLPEGQRVLLVEQLLENLPADSGEPLDDETFAAELDRRYDEYQRDPSVAVPWSDVFHEE